MTEKYADLRFFGRLAFGDFVSYLGGLFVAFGFDGAVELVLEFFDGVHGDLFADVFGKAFENFDFVGFLEGFFLAETGEIKRTRAVVAVLDRKEFDYDW